MLPLGDSMLVVVMFEQAVNALPSSAAWTGSFHMRPQKSQWGRWARRHAAA